MIISSTSNKGFEIEYTNLASNKESAFYLANNYEKKNYTPEEIIEFFFDNTIEQQLTLYDLHKPTAEEPKEKKGSKHLEFSFKPSLRPLFGFNFFFFLLLSVAYAVFAAKEPAIPKWGLFAFVFTWPIPIFVHLTYWFKNAGASVTIDTLNHNLTYIKGSNEIKFKREDIFRCQVTRSRSSSMSMCDAYSYVWFILNNNTHVIVTHFIADPYELVRELNCKFEEKAAGAFLPIT